MYDNVNIINTVGCITKYCYR